MGRCTLGQVCTLIGAHHRSKRNGFVARFHIRFAAVSRLSRAVSRCLALSRAVSQRETAGLSHVSRCFRRCRWGNAPTLYNAFWILDAKVARPPHATWYVRRVSSLPALQALTCRLGAPAHLCDEHAFSYPGRCPS